MRPKSERLVIAGAVAPVVREGAGQLRARRIKVYSQATGEVLRETTAIELVEKQLMREGIEIDTKIEKGKRPKALRCSCGMPFLVCQTGFNYLRSCPKCIRAQSTCDRCGQSKSRRASPRSGLCKSCNQVEMRARLDAVRQRVYARRRARTHCKHGHSLSAAYLDASGRRHCRTCRKLSKAKRKAEGKRV